MKIAAAVHVLRSLIFYLGYAVSILFYALFMFVVAMPLSRARRYRLLMVWNRFAIWWARIACGVRCSVSGLDNLPDCACVVVSNHQSSWETIYLATLFPQLSILLKRELLRIPFFGWALALMWPIAIDRNNPRAALRQVVDQGAERLAHGCSVLVFPEGTRVETGQALRFTRGAAQLAIRGKVSVVCVAHDAGKCWPARQMSKIPGVINVAISSPLTSVGSDAGALTRAAQSWIEEQLLEFRNK